MASSFDVNPYSSSNPTIDALFSREFAQRAAQLQAEQQAAQNELMRQQIAAQAGLAQAQLQGQQQAQNRAELFRMQELASREKAEADRLKIAQQQANTDEAYRKGLIAKPEARSQADVEEANAVSEAIASQLNAAYQTRLNTAKAAIEAQRKALLDKVTWYGGGNKDEINARHDQMIKDAADKEFQTVQDIGTKYHPGQYGVDPATSKFVPIRLRGTATGVPFKAPAGTPDQYDATGTLIPNVGAAAALGVSAAPAVAAPNPAALGVAPIAALPAVIRKFGNGRVKISAQDDEFLRRSLGVLPQEQWVPTYQGIMNDWLRTGRAMVVAPPGAASPSIGLQPTLTGQW